MKRMKQLMTAKILQTDIKLTTASPTVKSCPAKENALKLSFILLVS
jgi:hypothetical protein